MNTKPKNFKEYIADFPQESQQLLIQLYKTIKASAPEAIEIISYSMPAFKLNGILVYFAAYKNHIGFYPTGSGIEAFKEEIKDYKTSKGTLQFPLNKPLPIDLITQIVKYRVNENLQKINLKKNKK